MMTLHKMALLFMLGPLLCLNIVTRAMARSLSTRNNSKAKKIAVFEDYLFFLLFGLIFYNGDIATIFLYFLFKGIVIIQPFF